MLHFSNRLRASSIALCVLFALGACNKSESSAPGNPLAIEAPSLSPEALARGALAPEALTSEPMPPAMDEKSSPETLSAVIPEIPTEDNPPEPTDEIRENLGRATIPEFGSTEFSMPAAECDERVCFRNEQRLFRTAVREARWVRAREILDRVGLGSLDPETGPMHEQWLNRCEVAAVLSQTDGGFSSMCKLHCGEYGADCLPRCIESALHEANAGFGSAQNDDERFFCASIAAQASSSDSLRTQDQTNVSSAQVKSIVLLDRALAIRADENLSRLRSEMNAPTRDWIEGVRANPDKKISEVISPRTSFASLAVEAGLVLSARSVEHRSCFEYTIGLRRGPSRIRSLLCYSFPADHQSSPVQPLFGAIETLHLAVQDEGGMWRFVAETPWPNERESSCTGTWRTTRIQRLTESEHGVSGILFSELGEATEGECAEHTQSERLYVCRDGGVCAMHAIRRITSDAECRAHQPNFRLQASVQGGQLRLRPHRGAQPNDEQASDEQVIDF